MTVIVTGIVGVPEAAMDFLLAALSAKAPTVALPWGQAPQIFSERAPRAIGHQLGQPAGPNPRRHRQQTQHVTLVLPDAKGGGLSAAIGKGLNQLGDWTYGLTPSSKNHGGFIAQIPILLQAHDIHQKRYLVVPKDKLAALFPNLAGQAMSPEGLNSYASLSDKSKMELAGKMVIEVGMDEYSTYQNFTNGMANNLSKALVNAKEQTGSGIYTLNYNPNHGMGVDLIESAWDKFLGTNGLFVSGAAKWEGKVVANTTNNRAENKHGSNFANHSQGNILLRAGLISLDKDTFAGLEKEGLDQTSVVSYGSPVRNSYMKDTLKEMGITDYNSYVHPHDFVGEVLGRNVGHNGALADPALNLIFHLGDASLLGGSKYVADVEGEPLAFSPHSTYLCQVHCGRYGEQKVPDHQTRFKQYSETLHGVYTDPDQVELYYYERDVPVVDLTDPTNK